MTAFFALEVQATNVGFGDYNAVFGAGVSEEDIASEHVRFSLIFEI